MKHLKRGSKILAGIFGLMVGIGSANSAVVYDWTGACSTGCTGSATAVLTLTDAYVPGAAVTTSHFVSYSFESSGPDFSTLSATQLVGLLPATSGTGVITFVSGANVHFVSGSWLGVFNGVTVTGGDNQWTLRTTVSAVPLPASAWMFISSLIAFGLYGWWQRRKLAARDLLAKA